MLNKINPVDTKSWERLTAHYELMKDLHMKDLFAEDPERFRKFSIKILYQVQ